MKTTNTSPAEHDINCNQNSGDSNDDTSHTSLPEGSDKYETKQGNPPPMGDTAPEDETCAKRGSGGRLTKEQRQWLSDNRESYEFYLLHALLHDPLWRTKIISTPVTANDFWREEFALVMGAMIGAVKILGVLGMSLPTPPSPEFLRTYIGCAARQEGSDDEIVEGALKLVQELQDPKYLEMHYTIGPYFEGWYGSRRAKLAARALNKFEVPDVHGQIAELQKALSSAARAACMDEDDEMEACIHGTSLDQQIRRSTGIVGLDTCLNGGTGKGECYLFFGGSGSGKSLAAGQMTWSEAHANKGWPP